MRITTELLSIKKAITNVQRFVGEAHIVLEDDKLVLREFSADANIYYEAKLTDVSYSEGTEFDIFINAVNFGRLLKSLGKSSSLVMEYSKGKLTLTDENGNKTFQLPVYNDDFDRKQVPNVVPVVKGTIQSHKLTDIAESTQASSKDIVGISFNYDGGVMKVSGSRDGYKYEETIEEFINKDKTKGKAIYGVGWLTTIADCLISETVEFNYGTDIPLTVVDEGTDKISQRFILAPRIENKY